MDWRKRNYYLVSTDSCRYEMRHRRYKALSSVEIHPAKNHFKDHLGWDALPTDLYYQYWQELISCSKEDADALEAELKKSVLEDYCSRFCKLTKEITLQ